MVKKKEKYRKSAIKAGATIFQEYPIKGLRLLDAFNKHYEVMPIINLLEV